jgi:hypothetical protein
MPPKVEEPSYESWARSTLCHNFLVGFEPQKNVIWAIGLIIHDTDHSFNEMCWGITIPPEQTIGN